MAWTLRNLLPTGKVEQPPVQEEIIWTDAAVAEKVKAIIVERLEIPPERVVPEAEWFRDFDCSMDYVEVFMSCEEEFGLELPDEDLEECINVGKLTGYIQKRLGLPGEARAN